MRTAGRDRRDLVALAAAVVILAALSTLGLAAATGAFHSRRDAPNGACSAPDLPGSVVDVRLMNMGGRAPMMGGGMGGMMRIDAARSTVAAGQVSFRVANVGTLVHELVVLPLRRAANVGDRPVKGDNRVDEAGSVGEASQSCGAGAGSGIAPGALGWVTLDLRAGDYELICNLPGHYAAGMYTTLHVA